MNSGGFLGAPTPLNSGVLEAASLRCRLLPKVRRLPRLVLYKAASRRQRRLLLRPRLSPLLRQAPAAILSSVGAVSDRARAQQYQQRLSQQFSVHGRVVQNGAVWRIQLGPFASKSQASTVQQRLQSEAQLQSFITHAN